MVRNCQVGLDNDALAFIEGSVESFQQWSGVVASRPDNAKTFQKTLANVDTVFYDISNVCIWNDVDPHLFEVVVGDVTQLGMEGLQHFGLPFDEINLCMLGF